MESSMLLKCPISNCKWQFVSPFNGEQSFHLIQIHVDKEHISQQEPAGTAKLRQQRTDDKIVSTKQEALRTALQCTNRPPKSPQLVKCPKCKTPFRKFNGRNRRAFKVCKKCFLGSTNLCAVESTNTIETCETLTGKYK